MAYHEAAAGDGTTREEQFLKGQKLVLCICSLMLILFLVALDQTIVSTTFTEVGKDFGSFDKISWLVSGYMLASASVVTVYGKLSIVFGRKYSLLLAIFLFELGSLLCAVSQNMTMLIVARVIAGIGGGGIQSLTTVVASEVVHMNKRPAIMSLFGIVFAISSVLGPLVGGVFTTEVTWRWCYYINLPVGGFATALLLYAFNPPRPKFTWSKIREIDYIGISSFMAGIVLILLAMSLGGINYPWNSAAVICCFVLGGLSLIVFSIWNFKFSSNPLIPYFVIKVPGVFVCTLVYFFTFCNFMTLVIYGTLYFQTILNRSAFQSGIDTLALIIPLMVATLISTGLVQGSKQVKPVIIIGTILGPIGGGLMTLLDVDSPLSKRIGLFIISGVSLGIQMQTVLISAQLAAPKQASGLILTTVVVNFSRSIGGAIGANLANTIYSVTFSKKIRPYTENSIIRIPDSVLLNSPEAILSLPENLQELVTEKLMESLRATFYFGLGCASVAFIISLFVSNDKLPKKEKKPEVTETPDQSQDDNKSPSLDKSLEFINVHSKN
ncbi:Vacuolar basic amino acid transporter 5 [Komagataella phaffii CBS 7435]|uniref:Major facilitator superfamily (MFS) profile domain-containing protein n=2 Tax=Komagataella phaffii TaxID=460519 RepID=C4R524_KOMPG|nr:uncharacterized protein PAS_chr3_1201 [Komagataella phaffii GS115]AOA63788.1 GQ67_03692T0 [Komagataella phaffii]CAH2449569.1 Vacuolar basic amino acid transporter 5 [Komagataella phaffii CBS 7435]AOA69330.1 GQ68_03664T0 [Komagataella phaffii GS115]CAY70660.1 hypothetical protein PAS_chr3_1201 [Komagataella phaffii GS115]CCA39548.1 Vacuolar basic amino acid transporter 5 [Komagataella phaffii CBS 7435]